VAKPGFPRNIVEFQRWFPDEDACRSYLSGSRWPEGFRCPRCGCAEAVLLSKRSLWQCTGCRYQVSLTAGTVLQGTRTPLHLWFWAAYLMSTGTPGISAVQLQRQLGLGRYETAWIILQKLRRAMVNPERQPLSGAVEVDECFVGGLDRNLRGGRQHGTKALVVVAVEVRGAGCGRVRMQVIADASTATLCGFVTEVVAAGAVVHTDGWNGYRRLRTLGYDHRPRSQRTAGVPAADLDEILPRVHRVISNLKSWLRGTHRGVSREHLQVYLDEYVFRFNRRSTRSASRTCSASAASNRQPPTGTSTPRDPARPRLLTPHFSDAGAKRISMSQLCAA
jgi:transposase-like protein